MRYVRLACLSAALGFACSSDAPPAKAPAASPRAKAAPAKSARRPKQPEAPPLPPLDVVRAMRSNEKRLRMCFLQAPNASGFVSLGWDIDKTGVVDSVDIERSTIDNADVEECLATRTEELRFGELEHPSRGRWTYVFRLIRPGEDDDQPKQKGKRNRKRNKPNRDPAAGQPGVSLETTSPGDIDMGKVDEVVQVSYPLFARCYRDAISRNAGLAGWVALRVIIDRSGRVSRVLDGNSDLADPIALDCIAETFYALQFPKPRGGNAHVLYRMRLN